MSAGPEHPLRGVESAKWHLRALDRVVVAWQLESKCLKLAYMVGVPQVGALRSRDIRLPPIELHYENEVLAINALFLLSCEVFSLA